jgi:hypothetical protein
MTETATSPVLAKQLLSDKGSRAPWLLQTPGGRKAGLGAMGDNDAHVAKSEPPPIGVAVH